MAFRYNVNLIRSRIRRRRLVDNLVRLFTFSLLLFAVMLFVTTIIYLARYNQMKEMALTAKNIGGFIESRGVAPAEVGALQAENRRFERRLSGLDMALRASVPWVEILNRITGCGAANDIVLDRVESSIMDERITIIVEGYSFAEDPVRHIHNFVLMMEGHEVFGNGTIASMVGGAKRESEGRTFEGMRFVYRTPLLHPLKAPDVGVSETGGTDG